MDTNTKFLIEFKNQNASAVFEYNELGYLINYQLDPGDFKEEHFDYLLDRIPRRNGDIDTWKKWKFKNVRIKEIEPDLSFDAFYDRYNYKVSSRKRAERIWEKMDDVNRAKAIAYIPRYESLIIRTGYNKQYPETFLNQQAWNN